MQIQKKASNKYLLVSLFLTLRYPQNIIHSINTLYKQFIHKSYPHIHILYPHFV